MLPKGNDNKRRQYVPDWAWRVHEMPRALP